MRTKTLLLAVAALATGMISTEAQNVYSANVVGYVNVVVPQSPGWACVANPFDLDGVDNITNVLANAPKGTTCDFWTGASFSLVVKKSTLGSGTWGANATNVYIPPGKGFMIQCSVAAFTNTFVGNVLIAPGATNNLALGIGYQLVGSPVPYGGTLTNASDNGTNTLNLGSMPKGTSIDTWNNAFLLVAKRSTLGAGAWNANPSFTPAEGFFLIPTVATNWQQTLSSQ